MLCWVRGRWCCPRCLRWFRVFPLVRVLWRPVRVLPAVLVWVSQFLVLGFGVVGWLLLGVGARYSWLRAWWVHLCVLAVFLAALQLPRRGAAGFLFFGFSCVACVCGAGGARALVCGVRLWSSCRWRLWRCVLCACAGVCAVCWWCVWVPVLAFLGLVWRLCVGVGAVCRGPSPVSAVGSGCGSPPPLAGVCWWCVPPPPPLRALPPLSLSRGPWGGVPLVPCPGLPGGGGWGGILVVGSGPFPWCFHLGGGDACTPRQNVTLLYGPSICTRSVQMDLLCSQVLQPGSGTLWVAGESLRDRRVSCLPRWTVCPTHPLAGPEPQYVTWGVLLIRPMGHPPSLVPPRAADQRSLAHPTLLRVLRSCRYGQGRGPQTPEVGSLACVSRGPFSSRPPFRCVVCGGGFPVSPGWGGVGGQGRFLLFLAVLLVCVSPAPLVVVRRRCVCLWRGACARGVCAGVCVVQSWWRGCGCVFRVCSCVCVCVCAGVAGAGWCLLLVLVCVWLVCAVVGPSPFLAEVPECHFPPLLAGLRCRRWWVLLATPG